MLVAKLHTEPPGHFCTQTAWNKEGAAIPMRLYDAKEQAELTLYIPVSLLGTRCMRPVLRPLVDRRHLLTLGAKLSIATFRFGGHLAAFGRKPIRSGGGLRRRGRSKAVLCPGRRGTAHVVPSRRPRLLDALHQPARGV